MHHENWQRNRYSNIIPLDHNRVKLPVQRNSNDYINASPITLDLGSQYSTGPKHYIACQAPTEYTASHFWHMCYEQFGTIGVVLMLTPLFEKGHERATCYWPVKLQQPLTVPSDGGFSHDLQVSLVSVKDVKDLELEVRELRVQCNDSPDKTIYHIYMPSWQDFGRPSHSYDISGLVNYVDSLNNDTSSPLVVHCSAGIGRTGTYLALDYMLTRSFVNRLDSSSAEDAPDLIYELVSSMRKQRAGMVQRTSQYEYIYQEVRLAFSRARRA